MPTFASVIALVCRDSVLLDSLNYAGAQRHDVIRRLSFWIYDDPTRITFPAVSGLVLGGGTEGMYES